MQLDRIVAGFCGVTLVAGLGAVGVVAVPAGEIAGPRQVTVDPDPSTVGDTVTISNAGEEGRCPAPNGPPPNGPGPASEHEDSRFYVRLVIEPPTGEPTIVHAATGPDDDWEVEYTSDEVGVHEVTGECFDREGFQIRTTEWAAAPDLLAAPAGNGAPEVLHAYEGSFTVEAEDETTTTTTTTTTAVATTTTTAVAPGPDAGADTQTPPATPARATPTFVG